MKATEHASWPDIGHLLSQIRISLILLKPAHVCQHLLRFEQPQAQGTLSSCSVSHSLCLTSKAELEFRGVNIRLRL
jgi:hypothetical protein